MTTVPITYVVVKKTQKKKMNKTYEIKWVYHFDRGWTLLRNLEVQVPCDLDEFVEFLEAQNYNKHPSVMQGDENNFYAVYQKKDTQFYLIELFVGAMQHYFFASSVPAVFEVIKQFNELLFSFYELQD